MPKHEFSVATKIETMNHARVSSPPGRRSLLTIIGPGLLIAATGVGAGDLATASITGSRLGVGILWAVPLGAFMKFVLTEGLARYQLATGWTLLEGAVRRLGWPLRLIFAVYLFSWSYFVGSALMSACGVALHALIPVFEEPATGKVVFGIASSLVGVGLVRAGGFALFEKIMGVCIALMFVIVVFTASRVCEDWGAVAKGLTLPRIPDGDGNGLGWTVALLGGVGGTLTILCYGYWIREKGRRGPEALRDSRIDLIVGYVATAVFGIAMVIIGSTITVDGSGAGLIVSLADRLEEPMGVIGKYAFLLGAFGAVFSSLLGVWQAVPYLFADFCRLRSESHGSEGVEVDVGGRAYRGYLVAIAVVPMAGLFTEFVRIQRINAIVGALFVPMLAVVLLILNSRFGIRDASSRNRASTVVALIGILGVFVFFGYQKFF